MARDVAENVANMPEHNLVIQINVVARHEAGWTPYQIQAASGLSFKAISQILTTFESRARAYREKVSGSRLKPRRWVS